MSGTIFDLIPLEGKEGFFEEAAKVELPEKKSYFSKGKKIAESYAKSTLKGAIEGLYQFGRTFGPLPGKDDTKQLSEELDRLFPTEEPDYGSRSLRRGLKEAPTALSFPGASWTNLPRPIIAGFLGEGAKDLGLPEWAQSAAELTAYIGPDVIKKLLASGKNKELIDKARSLGMTDEQLTPLLQSEFKQKWLTKLTPKRFGTQKALKNSQTGLSKAYETIKSSEMASKALPETAERILQKDIDNILVEMPNEIRSKILKDYQELFASPVTGKSLMNFYSDINQSLKDSSKPLSLLKNPIQRALSNISPEMGNEFSTVNKLYSKYADISKRLKPTIASDIVSAAESLGILGSIAMGQPYSLTVLLGEQAVKKLSQQMLLNPHFQQLGRKMVVALNENKFLLAKKIMDDYLKLVRKKEPEIASRLEEISDDQLEEFFTHLQSKDK